ncbi:hypothetical protein ABZ883_23825, partial [Streptomyces sp. NPDC046977]|uniref:hypothetical protein n=1 Tax=Streptomyces sp. NPDC046977 TaxID=3154703 RepID=UPI0033F54DF3
MFAAHARCRRRTASDENVYIDIDGHNVGARDVNWPYGIGAQRLPDRPKTTIIKERPQVAELFYDDDADLSIIQGRKVAVIGYG